MEKALSDSSKVNIKKLSKRDNANMIQLRQCQKQNKRDNLLKVQEPLHFLHKKGGAANSVFAAAAIAKAFISRKKDDSLKKIDNENPF